MQTQLESSVDAAQQTQQRDPLAAAIWGVRAELGINQVSFAGLIGVKQPTVAQLESGKRRPSSRLAYRLAQVSGKPLETFVEAYYGKQIG